MASIKYKDNGTYKDIVVKVGDTLPIGTEVDYDGSVVPNGWEEVDDPNEYSTTEQVVGKWINGKPLYRKVIDMGTLPNNESKSVAHNLSNFVLRNLYGSATNGTYSLGIAGFSDEVYLDNTYVIWNSKVNRSTFSAYVILEYTKTTD